MRDLTKWPRLLVVGEPVTAEQAEEIIVRTTEWFIAINDESFAAEIYRVAGVELDGFSSPTPSGWSLRNFQSRHRVLELNYLNNERVASSWIGGPHGWVDWNGRVGCTNYNVGKYPDSKSIFDDWRQIAAAFPYLNLRAQLLPDEGAAPPAVEYRVHDGVVEEITDPDETLTAPRDLTRDDCAGIFSNNRRWEHGASIERIAAALERNLRAVGSR